MGMWLAFVKALHCYMMMTAKAIEKCRQFITCDDNTFYACAFAGFIT
jgi:hypothetical protein